MKEVLVFALIAIFSIFSSGIFIMLTKGKIWLVQVWLNEKFPNIPPFLCKILHYALLAYVLIPIGLAINFAFDVGPQDIIVTWAYSLSICFYLIRLYFNFFYGIYWPSTKWRMGLIANSADLLRKTMFWIFQFIVCFMWSPFSSSTYSAVLLSFNFQIYSTILFLDATEDNIDANGFCKEFTQYLEDRSKVVIQEPETSKAQDLKLQKEESMSEMPSIPSEIPRDKNQNSFPPVDTGFFARKNPQTYCPPIDIPQSPEENDNGAASEIVRPPSQENSKEPSHMESKVKLFTPVRTITPLVDFKVDLQKLIDLTIHKAKKSVFVNYFFNFMYFATLVIYAYFYNTNSNEKTLNIGYLNSIFLAVFDAIVAAWYYSDLHKKPPGYSYRCIISFLGRAALIICGEYWILAHTICLIIISFYLSKSLCDYYFNLNEEEKKTYIPNNENITTVNSSFFSRVWGYMWLFFRRFEIQILLIFVTVVLLALVDNWRPSLSARYMIVLGTEYDQVTARSVALVFIIEYIFIRAMKHIYTNNQFQLNWKLFFIFCAMWATTTSVYVSYYHWCSFNTIIFFLGIVSIYLPPILTCCALIITHWIKNDYSFYENLQSAPVSNPINSEPNLSNLQTSTCCNFNGETSIRMFLPRAANDCKVLFASLIFVGILTLSIRLLDCALWIRYTIAFWPASLWFTVLGISTYINKFYKLSVTIIVYISLGVLIAFLWNCAIFVQFHSQHGFVLEYHFAVLTAFEGYLICFFFVAVYMIIDMSFQFNILSIIFLIVSYISAEVWSITTYMFFHMYVILIIGNVFIVGTLVLLIFYSAWKNNNNSLPMSIFYSTFIAVVACATAGVLIYIYKGDSTVIVYSIFIIFCGLCFTSFCRLLYYKKEAVSEGHMPEVIPGAIFPMFRYNSNTQTMKSCNETYHQVVNTVIIVMSWGHALVILFPETGRTIGIVISSLTMCFIMVQAINTLSNSLVLTKKLLSSLDINGVVQCMHRAINAMETSEGGNRPNNSDSDIDIDQLLRQLKQFNNGDQWGSVQLQQMAEIGGAWSCFTPKLIDLEKVDDPELIKVTENIRAYNKDANPTYLTQLKNLLKICNTVEEKDYTLKALAASFIMQTTFRSVVNDKRHIPNANNVDLGESIRDLKPQKLALDGATTSKTVVTRKTEENHKVSSEVPSNVEFDENSFIDDEFIRNGFSGECLWLRAKDIPPENKEVTLFSNEYDGYIQQGDLGDCWVVAAITILATEAPHYLRKMFTADSAQENGKYVINIYSNGVLKTIALDDYFPCYTITRNPRCCQVLVDNTNNKKIIWPLLVEKTIAKEYGSYDRLNGGAIDYALMLMTGNPAFRYNLLNDEIQLRIVDNSLWLKILNFVKKCFLLGAGTLPKDEIPNYYEEIGGTHAYAILDAFEFDNNKLLELRDPRGPSNWKGQWSANSPKWTSRMREMVAKRRQKKSINRIKEDETSKDSLLIPPASPVPRLQRTFFISWEEFTKCFEVIFVSIFFDDSWECVTIKDEWKQGRAGGSIMYFSSVVNNPQYLLTVEERLEVFCLLAHIVPASTSNVPKIGFEIYKYDGKLIGQSGQIPSLVAIGRYSTERAISLNCELEKGKYIVLLATYDPNQYGKFDFSIWYPKGSALEQKKLSLKKLDLPQETKLIINIAKNS